MAEATINAGPYGVGHTKRVMADALNQKAASAGWWTRLQRAPKAAWGYIQRLASGDLASRAFEFAKNRVAWLRGLISDINPGRVVAYAATTIEGRAGIRAVLGFTWKVITFPFKLVGKPVSWVLRHTGRPGKWVYGTTLIGYCWTRDKVKAAYDTAEAWLEGHDDVWWMRWARGWLHWQIVSRIVDRLAPAWMPRWLRFIIKAGVPGFSYRRNDKTEETGATMASEVFSGLADTLVKVSDSLADDGTAAAGETGAKVANLVASDRKFRNTTTGAVHRFELLEGTDGIWLRPKGSTKAFVKGTVPVGYEAISLEEVAGDMTGAGEVPEPSNRAERREASREARRPQPAVPAPPAAAPEK